jgi:hypothetical protein
MLKSDLVQTDKHSIKIMLRRKNLRFLRRTNLIKSRFLLLVKLFLRFLCSVQVVRQNQVQ